MPFNRQLVVGNSGQNIIPFGSGGRGSVVSNRKQVAGGLPIFDETYDERQLNAESQYELAMKPWEFRDKLFGTINPLISGLVGGGNSAIDFGRVGGENAPLPRLPNSFVFSPQQTQQAVNAARAQVDQGTGAQKRQIAGDMASRGFSSRSPLAAALSLGADTGGRTRATDAEREIRLAHADMNAKQDLSVGQLAQVAWNNFNQGDIARRQTQADAARASQQNMIQLIAALSGLA